MCQVNNYSIDTVDEWVKSSIRSWCHEYEQDPCHQDEVDVVERQLAPFNLQKDKYVVADKDEVGRSHHAVSDIILNSVVGTKAIIVLA